MMKKVLTIIAVLCLTSVTSADLMSYEQSFETLNQLDPNALANDGWLVYGNVFDSAFNHLYGYGPFVAPNSAAGGPSAFSAIDINQGSPDQGAQQLVVLPTLILDE